VALAYVVMAAGLFALAKTSPGVDYSHAEVAAAPAE
jgi:AGZA family xanthine/uracil permease-like MFS transporter